MTFSEGMYLTMSETKSCMKHTMDLQEDISKQTQLPRKSNSQDYGGRHSIEIAKVLLDDVNIDVNDLVDLCRAQKFP